VGETIADLRLDGALGDRAGLVDYVAGLEREDRTVRVRMLDGGASRRSLRRLAGFSHPRVLAIHELVRHGGADVLVTDMPSPVTLALLTETGLPAPVGLVRRVMKDVAEALAAAHAEGLLHGALRPEGVGIDGDGHALLDDLGLHELRAVGSSDTDWFVAPERRGGRRRAARTDDVYAFGAIYYQALTRKPPMPDYASGRIHETRPLASRRPDLPARIAFVIGRALAADPKERYPGFEEIVADLS
jgi:serine/threonine protein kinase